MSQKMMQIHEQNPYLFSCDGGVFVPEPSKRVRYRKLKGLEVQDVKVLPFKYAIIGRKFYFVAVENHGYDESEYSLSPIEGIDLDSVEIVSDRLVRDKERAFVVLHDHYMVDKRTDR